MESKIKEKLVLDTCVVKDLISYMKNGQPTCKSNIDYGKVFSYINNSEHSISKCYITIFSLYELLSSFDENNFNEEFEQLIVLMPQTITSNYAREFIDDFDIMNLNEKSKKEQHAVIQNLRNLISDMYANYFADIFICLPIIFISILETTIKDKRKTFINRLNNSIEELKQNIWHFIKNQYNELLIASKNDRIKFLDNILRKISQLCLCMLNGLSKINSITYRKLNEALIEFNNCFKDKFNDIHVNKITLIFDDLFVWFKNNTNNDSFVLLDEKKQAGFFIKFIMDIIIKNTKSQASQIEDDCVLDCIYKLIFRNFFKDENKTTKNKIQSNFGLDINNIIDSNIIRLCKSGKYLKKDLPLLTVDKGMQENIKRYLPHSTWVYEQFKKD